MNYQSALVSALATFIKKYYKNQLFMGFGLLIAVILPVYLLFIFFAFNGQLGTTLRTTLFYLLIVATACITIKYIFVPLLKLYGYKTNRLSNTDAAKIIGNHFTEIDDKLINTLQLSDKLTNDNSENGLLVASIHQKMLEMKPFVFTKAINKKESFRTAKYATAALVLLLTMLVFQSNVFFEGSERLLKYNQVFLQKAPFIFDFDAPTVQKKGNDFTAKLRLIGEKIPGEAYIELDKEWIKMNLNDKQFVQKITNLQNDLNIRFKAGDFISEYFTIKVLGAPFVSKINIKLNYPKYLNKTASEINNTTDLTVPEGTEISWNLIAKNTDKLQFLFNNKPLAGENFYQKRVLDNSSYSLVLSNNVLKQTDSLHYKIEVIKDKYPAISAIQKTDSVSAKVLYFIGTANDDYGISNIKFIYRITNAEGQESLAMSKEVSFTRGSTNAVFSTVLDLNTLVFDLGAKISCYFQVFDNDGVNGAKSAKSDIIVYKAPTAEELEKITQNTTSDIIARMEKAMQAAKQVQQMTKDLQVKMNQSSRMDWQEKQKLAQLIQKQKELQNEVSDIKKEQEQNRTREKEFKKEENKVEEKMKELDKMFKETLSPELQELLKKLEELLKQENKEGIKKELDKMNMADKDMAKDMDRLQEQLKQLTLEKKINETADKLEKLAKAQEDLKKNTLDKNANKEENKAEQKKLNEQFDKIKEDLKDIDKKNEELKDKLDLEKTKPSEDKIDKAQEEASDNLEKNKAEKAAEKQQEASDEMKQAAQKMKDKLEQELKKREEEDYKTLRQLLENLISLSIAQEKNMLLLKSQPSYTPKFVELSKQQQKIKRDAEMIEDSLLALSKRNIKIQSFVNTEIGKINQHMEKSIYWFGERNGYMAASDQQYVMTSVNNLAVMLSEALKNMQAQMNKKKDGPPKTGQCKNPGPSEGQNKGSKPGEKPGMGTLKKLQEDLNKMAEERKEGKKPGTGENGQMSSQEFARMAAQQEALRKELEKLQKQLDEQGKGGTLGDINKTKEMMEQTEKDLVNKKFDAETQKRLKQIEIRLSQHAKAEEEQEIDEQRQGESSKPIPRTLPPYLTPYINELKKQSEILKTLPAELQPYYQYKVKTYYNNIPNG